MTTASKVLLISLALFTSCSKQNKVPSSYEAGQEASKIEGGSDEVLTKYQDILKGVVKIQSPFSSCTATLIQKDVLMTAQHCRRALSMDIKTKTIALNGVDVEVIDIKYSPTTDVALVKFKPNTKADELFKDVKFLPVSLNNKDQTYEGVALMAGYGFTKYSPTKNSFSGNEAEKLLAGLNYIVQGNPSLQVVVDELKRRHPNSPKNIIFKKEQYIDVVGIRQMMVTNSFKKGSDMKDIDIVESEKISDNQAVTMPGDSGGPIITFKDGQPMIVGVTSRGSPLEQGSTVEEITVKDDVTLEEKTIYLEKFSFDIDDNVKKMNEALMQAGFTEEVTNPANQVKEVLAKKDFSYKYKYNRFTAQSYSATDYEENSKFITETLKEFGY